MTFGMISQKSTAKRHVSIYGSHEGKPKRWELEVDENNPEDLKALKLAFQHPPKQCFPRQNPYPNVVSADWDTDIVKIDFDERDLVSVKRLCRILIERYPVLGGGFIIFQSSVKTRKIRDIGNSLSNVSTVAYCYKVKSYHAVFDGIVSKDEFNSILAWLCLHTNDWNLIKWFLMQLIKGTSALRIGFKGKKKPPKIVYRYGNQDKQIAKFLENRNFILDFLDSIKEK